MIHRLVLVMASHTENVHTENVHTENVHTQKVHTEKVHIQKVRTQKVHTQKVQTQKVQTENVHTQKAHTEMVHTSTRDTECTRYTGELPDVHDLTEIKTKQIRKYEIKACKEEVNKLYGTISWDYFLEKYW